MPLATVIWNPLELSSTAAKPSGVCARCGGMRYLGLVHQCSTTVLPVLFQGRTNEKGLLG